MPEEEAPEEVSSDDKWLAILYLVKDILLKALEKEPYERPGFLRDRFRLLLNGVPEEFQERVMTLRDEVVRASTLEKDRLETLELENARLNAKPALLLPRRPGSDQPIVDMPLGEVERISQ